MGIHIGKLIITGGGAPAARRPRQARPPRRPPPTRDLDRFQQLADRQRAKLRQRELRPSELGGLEALDSRSEVRSAPSGLLDRLEAFTQRKLQTPKLVRGPAVDALGARIGARAFASGDKVYWTRGAPAVDSPEGEALFAHEAEHLVQQARGRVDGGAEQRSRALERRYFAEAPGDGPLRFEQVRFSGAGARLGPRLLERALGLVSERALQVQGRVERVALQVEVPAGPAGFEAAARRLADQLLQAAREARPPRTVILTKKKRDAVLQCSPEGDAAAKWMIKVETEIDGDILNYNFSSRYPDGIPITREEMTSRGYLPVDYWEYTGEPYTFVVKAGVKPHVALKALFEIGPSRLECASCAVAVLYRAILELIGPAEFDAAFPKLTISQDIANRPNVDIRKRLQNKEIKDRKELDIGDWVYFSNTTDFLNKHPDSPWQGENAFYVYDKGTKRYYAGFGVKPKLERDMDMALMEEFNSDAGKAHRELAKKKLLEAWQIALEENDGDPGYALEDPDYLEVVDYYQYWGLDMQGETDKKITMKDFKGQGGGLRLDSIRRLQLDEV